MSKWPLGVFASVDAGLGVPLEVAHELGVPTVHLHAPQKASRTPRQAEKLGQQLAELEIEVTCIFAGFEGESYADIATVKRTVGLAPPATRAARLAVLEEIAGFAEDLGVRSIGLHLGFVPHDRSASEYHHVVRLTREICDIPPLEARRFISKLAKNPSTCYCTFSRTSSVTTCT